MTDAKLVGEEQSSLGHSPIGWILSQLKHVLRPERLAGTLIPSVLLGACLTILPIALLYFGNRHAIASPGPFVEVLVGASVVTGLAVLLTSRWVAPHVAAGVVGTTGYTFFSMSWVPGWDRTLELVIIWLAVSAVASVFVLWLLSNSRVLVTVAGIGSFAAAATLLTVAIASSGTSASTLTDRPVPDALAFSATPTETPNIYLFVLDGFANPDVTADQFADFDIDFDLDSSIARLSSLGFERDVAATSNYGQTIFSLPSTLNVEYHHTEDAEGDPAELWDGGIDAIRGNNSLVQSLRNIGYEYWFSSSGIWDPSSCDPLLADRCVGDEANDSEAKKSIWLPTPLRFELARNPLDQLPDPASIVDDILEERATRDSDGPYFAFAHIVSPHQPYRYEPDCSLRQDGEPGTTLSFGFEPEFRTLYADQARCLGELLSNAMTTLLAEDPDALIFLQADHGSEFEAIRDTTAWTERMARERLGIFRMTNLPDRCRSDDPAAQSAINTVPVIVGCLNGEEPDLVEPRYFFTSFDDPILIAEASSDFLESDG